jgi:hypothetical protein
MAKLKKARSITRTEYDNLSPLDRKSMDKTINAQFRNNRKASKTKHKTPKKEGNKARKRY